MPLALTTGMSSPSPTSAPLSLSLPPTVNMHVVGHCNFRCGYCYARFEQSKTFLPLPAARTILRELKEHGARRITFAGGEPTLHPDLEAMLRTCAEVGLVTSLVTNGSRLDRDTCRRWFPWLRWLVLSCDSHVRETNDTLGRKLRRDTRGQPARVDEIAGWLREWNAHRPREEQVRLKINLVITALNVHEDPSAWLAHLAPERVKLLQCCIVPGENDDAQHLRCDEQAFEQYHARVAVLEAAGVKVVAETSEDLLDSYAMVDPRGRFRQALPDGHVESDPIDEVGVVAAWQKVGGCNLERFRSRGGEYDAGTPSLGVRRPIVAIEGLDGSGKSTVVHALSARLDATLVGSPPSRLHAERAAADALPPAGRRAWYWKANREAMKDAIDLVFQGRRVVMDRCFASTAVYGAAERGAVASLAEVPRDVPRPDHVIFLSVPEEERQRRVQGRGDRRTAEEDPCRMTMRSGNAWSMVTRPSGRSPSMLEARWRISSRSSRGRSRRERQSKWWDALGRRASPRRTGRGRWHWRVSSAAGGEEPVRLDPLEPLGRRLRQRQIHDWDTLHVLAVLAQGDHLSGIVGVDLRHLDWNTQDLGLEGDVHVVLEHGEKAHPPLVLIVGVDDRLFDERFERGLVDLRMRSEPLPAQPRDRELRLRLRRLSRAHHSLRSSRIEPDEATREAGLLVREPGRGMTVPARRPELAPSSCPAYASHGTQARKTPTAWFAD